MSSERSWRGWRRRRRCRIGVVVQARAMLWAADGVANAEIARRCEVDADAVRRWRARFASRGSGWGRSHRERPWPQAVAAPGHGRGGASSDAYRTTGRRLDALVDPDAGGAGRDRQGRGGQDLGRSQPQAVAGRHVQGQQRPAVRGETRRCRRALPQPAGTCGGVLLRREDPVPGPGPHPTVAADEARSRRAR